MATTGKILAIVVRPVMELAIVAAFAYWGIRTGTSTIEKAALGITAPAAAFAVWGLVDFHHFKVVGEWLRLLEELVLSGLASMLLFFVGVPRWGAALLALSVAYHALVYWTGGRLIVRSNPWSPNH